MPFYNIIFKNQPVMRNLILFFCLLASTHFMHAQSVEVQGELKVTTVNQNNAGTDILVRNGDGTVAKRDVNTIGGVPSTGIVLSEIANNTGLINAGFANIGNVPLSFNFSGANNNVSTGIWKEISYANAPSNRSGNSAVWTGTEMIIWGGYANQMTLNTGGRYNPSTDTWTTMSNINAPSARVSHSTIWTGTEMIIFGGLDNNENFLNSGAKYNPTSDTWTTITITDAPAVRGFHSAIWTSTEMMKWGGATNGCEK